MRIWFDFPEHRSARFKTPWKNDVPLVPFYRKGKPPKKCKIPKIIRRRVKALKKFETIPEKVARKALNELQIPFARQQPICVHGKWYIMDFHLWRDKICLEIDGKQHRKQKAYDALRDKRLMETGLRTVRIENVLMHNVLQAIYLIGKAIHA